MHMLMHMHMHMHMHKMCAQDVNGVCACFSLSEPQHKEFYNENSLARHWARDWRALALTQQTRSRRAAGSSSLRLQSCNFVLLPLYEGSKCFVILFCHLQVFNGTLELHVKCRFVSTSLRQGSL